MMKTDNRKANGKSNLIFGTFFVISIVIVIVFSIMTGRSNYGMEGDEVFSYISSTSMGGFKEICFLNDQTWYDASYFQNALTATGEECFNVKMVVDNQAMDTHPPLYYLCLNFICSIFAGKFSPWFGIGINIFFAILAGAGLFLLMNYFLKNRYMSLILSTIFSCSYFSVSMILFIRMYVLLTALVLFQSWLHLKLYDKMMESEEGLPIRNNSGWYLILGILTILGSLTHYYFLIYQCLIAAVYVLALFRKKRPKDIFRYVGTMMVSGGLYVCLYPAMLNHIFFKYRGREAVHKFLRGGTLFGEVISMLKGLDEKLFRGCLLPIMLILLIGTIILIAFRKMQWRSLGKGAILLLPACIYFFGISKASPFVAIKYVSPVAPVIFAAICVWIKELIDHTGVKAKWKKICYFVQCILLFFTTVYFFNEPIKETVYMEKRNVIEELAGKTEYCVYVTGDDYNWKMWEDYILYPEFKGLYFIDGREEAPIEDTKLKEQDQLVIFVDKALDGKEIQYYLEKYLNLEEYEVEYSSSYVDIVLAR